MADPRRGAPEDSAVPEGLRAEHTYTWLIPQHQILPSAAWSFYETDPVTFTTVESTHFGSAFNYCDNTKEIKEDDNNACSCLQSLFFSFLGVKTIVMYLEKSSRYTVNEAES